MALSPIRTYQNLRVQPVIFPEFARTDTVVLMPGIYPAGQALGHADFGQAARNEVQTVTVAGTGGTFRLGLFGAVQEVTGALAFNITSAALQAALEALPGIGAGNVLVTGGPGATAPLVVTFSGQLAARPMPTLSVYSNSVTGGAGPSVVRTTSGRTAGGVWLPYNNASADGSDVFRRVLEVPTRVDLKGRHFMGASEIQGAWELCAPAWYRGYFRTVDITGLDAAAIVDVGSRFHTGDATQLNNAGTILQIG
jgi:hypothetical protein